MTDREELVAECRIERRSAGSSVSILIVPPGAPSAAGVRGRTLTQTRPSATTTSWGLAPTAIVSVTAPSSGRAWSRCRRRSSRPRHPLRPPRPPRVRAQPGSCSDRPRAGVDARHGVREGECDPDRAPAHGDAGRLAGEQGRLGDARADIDARHRSGSRGVGDPHRPGPAAIAAVVVPRRVALPPLRRWRDPAASAAAGWRHPARPAQGQAGAPLGEARCAPARFSCRTGHLSAEP